VVELADGKIVNDKKIKLRITTPRGLKFDVVADMVIMRCIDGNLGVLYGHEPVSTILGEGILRIINDRLVTKLAVFGGIAEIGPNYVNIFTTIAQRPEEIDLERAQRDRELAEAAIREKEEDMQIHSARALLHRALVRIDVSLHIDDYEDFEEQIKDNDI
jgi:F-type H+-transporting ATPase subunit epsilon